MLKLSTVFRFSVFLFLLLLPFSVHAGTVLEDVKLNLSIETQDLVTDFADEDETVEKGRRVIYRLEVVNTGPQSFEHVKVFMDDPNYMVYQPGSTIRSSEGGDIVPLLDVQNHSALSAGYMIDHFPAGSAFRFEARYQVTVPESVLDDPLHTVAIASMIGPYSSIPVMSQPVNNTISGSPLGSLNVAVTASPPEGQVVFSGTPISYTYTLTNAGGTAIDQINFITYLPEGTICLENCGTTLFPKPLEPGQSTAVVMKVQVKVGQQILETIKNIGYDVSTKTLPLTEVREAIIHLLNDKLEMGTNAFTLMTEQVPNLVLNSSNGKPRADQADMTETQYVIKYTGRGKYNTYTLGGGYGIQDSGDKLYHGYCSDHSYPHGKNSTVFAYNSTGGGCEEMSSCLLQSSPLQFLLSTQLPDHRPSLILSDGTHQTSKVYSYGDTNAVNHFMKTGGVIKAPLNFTLSRAVEDGQMGEVNSNAQSQAITEDLWIYSYAGYEQEYDTCSCGEDCQHTDSYPAYTWQKKSSSPVDLKDDDKTDISVYASTAWLKTQGGNLGTNGRLTNSETRANHVPLTFVGEDYMERNRYVHDPETVPTPSKQYTPDAQSNADTMIFSGGTNEAMHSEQGQAWQSEGAHFPFLQQGEAYDRKNNPRDFREDLLMRQKYGPVVTDQLPATLKGTVDIGDNQVWHQTGDLIIGQEGLDDQVVFSGGQSRIYVDGDVYLNANIFYKTHESSNANDITSVRIDARNIYISGEVHDLELLMLARDSFHSGESFKQLRILGDVIAKAVFWERKPTLEVSPDDVNRPSEYIIEDYRKYILPVPGDAELPDEYIIWKQG